MGHYGSLAGTLNYAIAGVCAAGRGAGGFSGVAGAGWAAAARHGDDGLAGGVNRQRPDGALSGVAGGHHWLPAGRLDLLPAGLEI